MDMVTNKLTQESGSKTTTATETSSVVITKDGTNTITVAASSDAGGDCVTHATVSGDKFTLESGESCVTSGLTRSFTSGSATLSGSSYMGTRSFSFSGSVMVTLDGGATRTVSIMGTGTSTGTCTKG